MSEAASDRRTRMRAGLSRHRHHPLVRAASSGAGKLVNATRNLHNWDPETNGEMATVRWALAHHEGDVFDVGSNEGQWVGAALDLVGSRTVHCFEPVPSTYRVLADLDLPPQVRRNNLGLGLDDAVIELNLNPDATDVTSRYPLPEMYRSDAVEVVEVSVVTGDGYCRTNGVEQIALLKIDVEGMEYEALAGFGTMLAERRIAVIQFEYGLGYIGARRFLGDMADLLVPLGYQLHRQYPDGHEPFTYSLEDEDFRARNFVATLT